MPLFYLFPLLDTVCECVHLSNIHPDLYVACLQFLALLFSEEGKRQVQSKEDASYRPTVGFLLDDDEESQASVAKLCEAVIQVDIYHLLMFGSCVSSVIIH